MWKYLLPIIAFVVMIPIFIVGMNRNVSELPSPLLEKQAPQFELPALHDPNDVVGSKTYEGQVALVNVWATWCTGCRAEHGFLMELAQRNEVPIFGLNWRDQRAPAVDWLEKLGDPYIATAYDEDGRVGIDWGVYGAPETFLIGADGTVIYKHISPLNEQVWQQEFLPRIRAARSEAR
jgi:cytochrome c biogenesis protein CcmG/thiol:disulfide interchange protein DsbE